MPETGVGQNRVSFYVEDVWDTETPAKPTVIVQPVNIYNRLGDTLTVDRSFQVPLERTTRQETVNGGAVTRQVWRAEVRFVAPTLLANLIVINPDGLFRSYPILFNPTQGATLSDMFQKGRELMKAEATSGEIRRHVDQVLQEITDLKRSMEYLADTGIKDGAVTVPKLAVETKTYIQTQVNNRVDQIVGGNVTGSLDTLKEIADAITGNQNVITNLIAQIGDRYTKTESDSRFASASHTHSSSQITDATHEAKANMIVKRDASKSFGAGTIWLENQPTNASHATRKDYVDSLGPVATKVNAATAAAQPNKLVMRNAEGNIHIGDETKQGEALLDLRSQKLAFRILANDNTGREEFGVWRLKDETTSKRGAGAILRYLNQTNTWNFQNTKITGLAEPANDADAVNWGKVKNAVKWTSEATAAATASTLVWRDSNGRAQVRDPQDNWDIANKQYVQPTIDKVNAATAYDVPNTLVQRSETGFIGAAMVSVTAEPTQGTHVASKQYVDDRISELAATKDNVTAATSSSTAYTIVKRDGNKAFGAGIIWLDNQPTNPNHVVRKDYVDSIAGTAVAGAGTLVRRDAYGSVTFGDAAELGESVAQIESKNLGFRLLTNDKTDREDFGIYRYKDGTTANRGQRMLLRYYNKTDQWTFHGRQVAGVATPSSDDHAVNMGYVKNAVKWTSEATAAATASTLVWRDSNGRAQIQNPASGLDIVNKRYVDNATTSIGEGDTRNKFVKTNSSGYITATAPVEAGTNDTPDYTGWPRHALVPRRFVDEPLRTYRHPDGQFTFYLYPGGLILVEVVLVKAGYWCKMPEWAEPRIGLVGDLYRMTYTSSTRITIGTGEAWAFYNTGTGNLEVTADNSTYYYSGTLVWRNRNGKAV